MPTDQVEVGATSIRTIDLDALKTWIPDIGAITNVSTMHSAVTTEWKVRWDVNMIARDLMQNFRDANLGELDRVKVKRVGADAVLIRAPREFDVAHLYYLGSTKSASNGDVGGFGEGFKAASVALLRDHGVQPIVISGQRGVKVGVSDQPVPGTELRPLIYQFFDLDGATAGTSLLLVGMNRELKEAVVNCRDWFFAPSHPRINGAAWQRSPDLDVYPASGKDGLAFYRGQLCGHLAGVPVIFDLKRERAALRKHYTTDRDRSMLDASKLGSYYDGLGSAITPEVAAKVIQSAKQVWGSGQESQLLTTIIQRANRYGNRIAAYRDQIWSTEEQARLYVLDHHSVRSALDREDETIRQILRSSKTLSDAYSAQADPYSWNSGGYRSSLRERTDVEESHHTAEWQACQQAKMTQLPSVYQELGIRSVFDRIRSQFAARSNAHIESFRRQLQGLQAFDAEQTKLAEAQKAAAQRQEREHQIKQRRSAERQSKAREERIKSDHDQYVTALTGDRLLRAELLVDVYNRLLAKVDGRHFQRIETTVSEVQSPGEQRLPLVSDLIYSLLIPRHVLDMPFGAALNWLSQALDEFGWHTPKKYLGGASIDPAAQPVTRQEIAVRVMEDLDVVRHSGEKWESLRSSVAPSLLATAD